MIVAWHGFEGSVRLSAEDLQRLQVVRVLDWDECCVLCGRPMTVGKSGKYVCENERCIMLYLRYRRGVLHGWKLASEAEKP